MSHTKRASYPRAIFRDRSLSRHPSPSRHPRKGIQKGGFGRYNWGCPFDERLLEEAELDALAEVMSK